jgi:hypothetical protein
MLIELPNFHRPTTIDYFLQKKTLGKSFLDWKLSIGCMTERLPPAQTCPQGGASE